MLTIDNVTFEYTPGRGIRGASLRLQPGETVGVVGGNGAGKSTLLGLAAAALVPQAGRVELALSELSGRTRRYQSDVGIRYRQHVGYLTELAPVYGEMSVVGYLRFRARLRGISFLRIRRSVNRAMERCGLQALRRESVGRLSLGLRRRVALAEALLSLPEVLVLDDPFAGIDATLRASLAEVIRDVAARSHVLISGHDPEMLASCCTRFVLVEKGRIVADNLSPEAARAHLCLRKPEETAEPAKKEATK